MNKLEKFRYLKSCANVLEYSYSDYINNVKNESVVAKLNKKNLIIELAAGKAEHTIAFAKKNKSSLYIAVDIKGDRLWKARKICEENNIENVFIIRTDVLFLKNILPNHSVAEIWITFPDPYLKKSKASKRLTHLKFLNLYKIFLKKHGVIHLKTDSHPLLEFTLSTIKEFGANIIDIKKKNISESHSDMEALFPFHVVSYYEQLNLSKSQYIYYLSFSL